MTPLTIVPRETQLTGEARYEVLWNELSDFIAQKLGAIDEKALRIWLSVIAIHLFTKEAPIALWIQGSPPWLSECLGRPLATSFAQPELSYLINALREQTSAEGSVWSVANGSLAFSDELSRVRQLIDAMAHIARGRLDWSPRGVIRSRRRTVPEAEDVDPHHAFTWKGRVTLIVQNHTSLTPHQALRWRGAWETAENAFTVMRYEDRESDAPRAVRAREPEPGVMAALSQLIRNLLDIGFRDPKFRSEVPPGFFDPVVYISRIARAVRGPSFDSDLAASRAIRIAVAHASLMAKQKVDAEDLTLARKLTLDAIPRPFVRLLKIVPLDSAWQEAGMAKKTGLPLRSVQHLTHILLASEAIRRVKGKGPERYRVTAEFQRYLMPGFD